MCREATDVAFVFRAPEPEPPMVPEPDEEEISEAIVKAAAYLDSAFALVSDAGCNLHLAVDADSNTLSIVVTDATHVFSLTKEYDGSALLLFDGMLTEIHRAYMRYAQTGQPSPSVVIERIGS